MSVSENESLGGSAVQTNFDPATRNEFGLNTIDKVKQVVIGALIALGGFTAFALVGWPLALPVAVGGVAVGLAIIYEALRYQPTDLTQQHLLKPDSMDRHLGPELGPVIVQSYVPKTDFVDDRVKQLLNRNDDSLLTPETQQYVAGLAAQYVSHLSKAEQCVDKIKNGNLTPQEQQQLKTSAETAIKNARTAVRKFSRVLMHTHQTQILEALRSIDQCENTIDNMDE